MNTASTKTKCLESDQRYSIHTTQPSILRACLKRRDPIPHVTPTMTKTMSGTDDRDIRTINHDHETANSNQPHSPPERSQKRYPSHTEGLEHHCHKANDTFLRIYYPIPQVELLHVFQSSTLRCLGLLSSPRPLPYTPGSGLHKDSRPKSPLAWMMSGG
jgi:hypothetical protein